MPYSMTMASPSTDGVRVPASNAAHRVHDDAVESLAAAIHRELRESLSPEDIIRLTSALLARVTEEVARRPAAT